MPTRTLQSDIYSWLRASPNRWFRYAGNKIFHGEAITDALLNDTLTIFCQDTGLEPMAPNAEQYVLPASQAAVGSVNTPMVLHRLSDVKGVNRIEQGHAIQFHKGLTVIFGINGSGKSGYARVMKKAFRTHGDKTILPDVFSTTPAIAPECTFEVGVDGTTPIDVKYPSEGANPIFSRVTVFDTGSGGVHLDSESNLLFTPQGFEFFHIMSTLFQGLEQKLNEHIQRKQTRQDFRGLFGNANAVQSAIFNLTSRSNIDELKALGTYGQTESDRIGAIIARQNEITSLNSNARLMELNNVLGILRALSTDINALETIATSQFVETVMSTIGQCKQLDTLSKQESISAFEGLTIPLLGSNDWINFLRATSTYLYKVSEGTANTIEQSTQENCPLCLQTLSQKEQELFQRYWTYLKSEAQAQLRQATSNLEGLLQRVTSIPTTRLQSDLNAAEYIATNSPNLLSLLSGFITEIEEYRTVLVAAIKARTEISAPFILHDPKAAINSAIEAITQRIEALQISSLNQEMSALNNEAALLRDKSQLHGILQQVLLQIEDMKWVDKANRLVGTLGTRPITDKGKALFTQYITEAYTNTFTEECKRLNAPPFVQIVERATRGNTIRKMSVKSYRPTEILSEGEQRVISLAAFLTEARLDPHNIAIVVDDPANSLDDERKDCIAKRLVDESLSRQVIVFTHDLPFLHSLYELSEDGNRAIHWVTPIGQVWANNSPLLEAKYKTETPAEEYYRESNSLGPQAQQMCLRNGFAALATCYEYLVEKVILHNTIQRFSKEIRFGNLRHIKIDEQLFNEIHTAYGNACDSKEGHLPSDRQTSITITRQMLRDAIDLYKTLRERQKALSRPSAPAA